MPRAVRPPTRRDLLPMLAAALLPPARPVRAQPAAPSGSVVLTVAGSVGRGAFASTCVLVGHGPLGAVYPPSGWDPKHPGVQEGDTPSFLYLVSGVRGVNDPEKPDQPGWGGQFIQPNPSRRHWFDDPAGTVTVSRWRAEVQADFARRADWMLDSEPAH